MKSRVYAKRLLLFHVWVATIMLIIYLADYGYKRQDDLKEIVQNNKDNWYFIFGVLAAVLGVITIIFVLLDERKRKSPVYVAMRSAPKYSAKEYQTITKSYTASQLEKLYSSPEYQTMQSQKGESPENWNWQEKHRLAMEKKAQGEQVEFSDSD